MKAGNPPSNLTLVPLPPACPELNVKVGEDEFDMVVTSMPYTASFLAAAAFVVFILVSLSNFFVDFEGFGGRSAQRRK